MTPAAQSDYRIFRAIEKVGDEEITVDFEVPAAFLRASEVLDVMAESSGPVLVSDDNVIPFRDSIKSVEALVGWLTRRRGFQIDEDNVRDLAMIADKYIIDSLHQDIKNYSRVYLWRREQPTLSLWLFAVRYSLDELEVYCHSDSTVFKEIKEILRDPQKGLAYLINIERVPVSAMNNVIAEILEELGEVTKTLADTQARNLALSLPKQRQDHSTYPLFIPPPPIPQTMRGPLVYIQTLNITLTKGEMVDR